jgi:hypothetical protein
VDEDGNGKVPVKLLSLDWLLKRCKKAVNSYELILKEKLLTD